MTSSEDVAAAVADCVDRFGRIDILVNNVGGSAPGYPVAMTEEDWDKQIDLNLKTVFLGCKHVLPVMERQFENEGRGGAIVNVGSIGSRELSSRRKSECGLCCIESRGYRAQPLHCHCLCQKGYPCEYGRPRRNAYATSREPTRTAARKGRCGRLIGERHASVPMGRMGDAWDVAHAVLFLSSDEARYITATQIVVDGGMTAARPGMQVQPIRRRTRQMSRPVIITCALTGSGDTTGASPYVPSHPSRSPTRHWPPTPRARPSSIYMSAIPRPARRAATSRFTARSCTASGNRGSGSR